MLIVLGTFIMTDASDRDGWLQEQVESLLTSRRDPGCLEMSLAADPVDLSRVLLIELWDTLENLQSHIDQVTGRGGEPNAGGRIASFDSMRFDVSGVADVDLPVRFAPRSTRRGWWNGDLTPA